MKIKFSWLIYFLVVFVPFEILLLKFLPVSDVVYGYLRFLAEVLIYSLAGILLIRVLESGKLPKGTSIDKPLLIFIGYALLITLINKAPVLEAFVGLRSLLRYLPLFYVMAFVSIEHGMVKKYFNLLLVIAAFQGLVTFYQHYVGISDFWYPRASDLEIGGKQVSFRLLSTGFGGGREQGAGIGTFGDSVPLALFMVIAFVMLFSALQSEMRFGRNKKLLLNVLAVIILLTIFFTYSRGSVLIAILTMPLLMFLAGKRKKMAILFVVSAIALSPFLINMIVLSQGQDPYINPKLKYTDPLTNVLAIFNDDYVDNTLQFSRGLVLTQIGGQLLETNNIIGYSPAQDFALEKAASKMFGSNTPINNLPVINDVYWVAFVIYYGFLGLAIFLYILYLIFKASMLVYKKSPDPYFKIIALAMAVLVVISIPYSMILRTFLFRSYGFYFWMMAGLVFAEWKRIRSATSSESELQTTT